jgi:hypothetical protein
MGFRKTPLAEALAHGSMLDSALYWFSFGYSPIPILPGTKQTAVPWVPWRKDLNEARIGNYWGQYPQHEVGILLGDRDIVFDADSPESLAAVYAAERQFGVEPKLIVGTKHGEHHYFRLAKGTRAKTAVFCTKDHPERVDIKAAGSMVAVWASTDKTVLKLDVQHADELSLAPQGFVEALGGSVVKTTEPDFTAETALAGTQPRTPPRVLKAYLSRLDPDMHRTPWFSVGAAVHYETHGSAQGYALYDAWSARGTKYKGKADTKKVWTSIKPGHPKPATVGTLKYLLNAAGRQWYDIPVEPDDAPDEEAL